MLSAVAGLAQAGGPGPGAGVLAGFGSGSGSGLDPRLARPKPGRVGATTFARDERVVDMPERVSAWRPERRGAAPRHLRVIL